MISSRRPSRAESSFLRGTDSSKHRDAFHPMLVVENVQYFLHEGLVATVIRLAQVDTNDRDSTFHSRTSQRFRAI